MSILKIGATAIDGVDLVIFDRDGTLIDLFHYWSHMIQLRADLLCQQLNLERHIHHGLMDAMGVDVANRRLKPEGPVGLKKREVVMQAAIDYVHTQGIYVTAAVCQDLFSQADELSRGLMHTFVKPIAGALTLIDELLEDHCRVAIATTDRQERGCLTMEALGIRSKFSCIVGVDSVRHGKPAPDMIEYILKEVHTTKEKTIMVGDAVSDVMMGINAGVKASVGVLSGLTSREKLLSLTDCVIQDVSEMQVLKKELSYGKTK